MISLDKMEKDEFFYIELEVPLSSKNYFIRQDFVTLFLYLYYILFNQFQDQQINYYSLPHFKEKNAVLQTL